MENISAKERAYLQKWQKIRERKWQYVLKTGWLMWGLPCGIVTYFLNISFEMHQFEITSFIVQLFVFSLAGIGFGYVQYKAQEKRFQSLAAQLKK
jgi:hypothetical protein